MIRGGWYSGAIRSPGPTWKVYPGDNPVDYYICHSFEAYPVVYSPVYDTGVDKSWHFTQWPDGKLEQHYPITARCWSGGNQWINERGVATELVGFAGEPITALAVNAQMSLFSAIQDYSGRTIVRDNQNPLTPHGIRLVQHSEVATIATPNHGPTACPSGRWDSVLNAIAAGGVPMPGPTLTVEQLNEAVIIRLAIQGAAAVLQMGATDPDYERVKALYNRLQQDGYLVDW